MPIAEQAFIDIALVKLDFPFDQQIISLHIDQPSVMHRVIVAHITIAGKLLATRVTFN